jgi:hypothetical protein
MASTHWVGGNDETWVDILRFVVQLFTTYDHIVGDAEGVLGNSLEVLGLANDFGANIDKNIDSGARGIG